eukprot:1452328-Rhodomonas_salina.1
MFAWNIWPGMVVLGADRVDLKGSEGPDEAVSGAQVDYVGQEEKLVQSVREECDLIVERHRRKRVRLPGMPIRMLLLLFLVLVASSILLRALLVIGFLLIKVFRECDGMRERQPPQGGVALLCDIACPSRSGSSRNAVPSHTMLPLHTSLRLFTPHRASS